MKRLLGVLSVLAVLLLVLLFIHERASVDSIMPKPYPAHPALKAEKPLHPIFPHSIIAGGIHSLDDLLMAHRAGYLPADFNMKTAHFMRLHSGCFFVTFRKNNGMVAWSSKRVCVREGELAISDGKYFILARCGNLIATMIPPNVPVETIPVDADIPQAPVTTDPQIPSTLYPPATWIAPTGPVSVTGGGFMPLPPIPPSFVCCAFPTPTPTPTPMTVPDGDDGVWVLAVAAIAYGTLVRRKVSNKGDDLHHGEPK